MDTVGKIICSFILSCSLVSCYDNVVEGCVITNPIDTTQIYDTEVVCGGKVIVNAGSDVQAEIVETGFLYSKNELTFTDSISSTYAGEIFSCHLIYLSRNTPYYVRAYAVITCKYIKEGSYKNIIYGNIEKFTTRISNNSSIEDYQPQNLTAKQVGSYIVLNWNAPLKIDLIWNYVIEKSSSESGIYEKYGTSNFLTPAFKDEEPLEGMNYYRVKAVGSYSLESDYIYASCNFE